MQRPIGVTLTAILMVVNIFVDIAVSLTAPAVVTQSERSGPGFSTYIVAVHAALAALVLIQCVVVLYYWLGRSWARWFVLVGCVYYLVGLKDFVSLWHRHSYVGLGLTVGSAALAVYLIWYLHTSDLRSWFARSTIAASATNK